MRMGLRAGISLGSMQFVMFCSYAAALFYGANRIAQGAYNVSEDGRIEFEAPRIVMNCVHRVVKITREDTPIRVKRPSRSIAALALYCNQGGLGARDLGSM